MREGGTRGKKPTGEQSWSRFASFLNAFRGREILEERRETEEKVLKSVKSLICVVREMSLIGRSSKGL